MKKRRIVILIFLGLLAVAAIAGFAIKTNIENNLGQLADATIPEVDLSTIEDGTYAGSYKVFPVSVKVDVTVENHRITFIDLIEHKNGQGAPAEVIPGQVIKAQSLDVDAVTGATYSSKVILLAIENALNGTK